MTYAEELDLVNKAIKAIYEGGQEYYIGGRRMTRGDLKVLLERKRELEDIIALQTTGNRAFIRFDVR